MIPVIWRSVGDQARPSTPSSADGMSAVGAAYGHHTNHNNSVSPPSGHGHAYPGSGGQEGSTPVPVPASYPASDRRQRDGQPMSVMDAFVQMKGLLDRLERERIARRIMSDNRLMWVQEESEVDMRLAKLGYSAFGRLKSLDSSSSNAFGGRRSPDSAHGYQGHYNSREPRVISATPINNPSEHERLGWSASGRRSPLLQAECGVLTDEMLNANAERKLYVLKLEELRDELIRRCPEFGESVARAPAGINTDNPRESQELIDRAVKGGNLDHFLQVHLVDSARELEALRQLECRILAETGRAEDRAQAQVLCPQAPMSVLERSEAEARRILHSTPGPSSPSSPPPLKSTPPPPLGPSPPRPWGALKLRNATPQASPRSVSCHSLPSSVPLSPASASVSPRAPSPHAPAVASPQQHPYLEGPPLAPSPPHAPSSSSSPAAPSRAPPPPLPLFASPSHPQDHQQQQPPSLPPLPLPPAPQPPSSTPLHLYRLPSPPSTSSAFSSPPPIHPNSPLNTPAPPAPSTPPLSSISGRSLHSPHRTPPSRTITARPQAVTLFPAPSSLDRRPPAPLPSPKTSPLDRRPPVPLAPCASPDIHFLPPSHDQPPPFPLDRPESPSSSTFDIPSSVPSTPVRPSTSAHVSPPTPTSPHTPQMDAPRPRTRAANSEWHHLYEQRRNSHPLETPPRTTPPSSGQNTVAM